MIKKDKIKEVYGKNYNPHNIDENGWMGYNLWLHFFKKVEDDYDEFDNRNMRVRPNSLTGIENNNGWIKIESEEQYDELENGEYEWYNINNGKYDKGDLWTYGIFTHYKIVPIIKSDAPLY